MARGWESKSVESQMESLEERRKGPPPSELTLEQTSRLQEQKHLEMSRLRVLHDLESATNPRYREQLEAALAHLDAKLLELG